MASSTLQRLREVVRRQGLSSAMKRRGAAAREGGEGVNVVAFSGGVDSSLVAALVHSVYPDNSFACIGLSAALPAAQHVLARRVAAHIGIELREVQTREGEDAHYVANAGQSCFHCKSHLYSSLQAVAAEASRVSDASKGSSFSSSLSAHTHTGSQPQPEVAIPHGSTPTASVHTDWVEASMAGRVVGERVVPVMLFNGTNKDDKRDPTRVGLKAASNFGVSSPIDSLTKEEVRGVALELGLPNWNYAASPCLRSRLAFGVEATPERLRLVEMAEEMVKDALQLSVSHNLRVRHMDKGKALVEVDQDVLHEALASGCAQELQGKLTALGFSSCDFRPFKSGSLSGYSQGQGMAPTQPVGATAVGGTAGVEVTHVKGTW